MIYLMETSLILFFSFLKKGSIPCVYNCWKQNLKTMERTFYCFLKQATLELLLKISVPNIFPFFSLFFFLFGNRKTKIDNQMGPNFFAVLWGIWLEMNNWSLERLRYLVRKFEKWLGFGFPWTSGTRHFCNYYLGLVLLDWNPFL